jgi:hypothetical protein
MVTVTVTVMGLVVVLVFFCRAATFPETASLFRRHRP